jgi:RNA polymerase sigma factor (sigma-70 family)
MSPRFPIRRAYRTEPSDVRFPVRRVSPDITADFRQMHELASPQDLLVQHIAQVRRVSAYTARRIGLSAIDAEECAGWVELRLVEDDYAQVRKFRGESSFKTFITVVVAMLVRDFRRQIHGKWRPSATATRLGVHGIHLERAVHRDGCSGDEAVRAVQSTFGGAPDEKALRALLRQLPRREPMRPETVDDTVLGEHPHPRGAQADFDQHERDAESARLTQALSTVVDQLPSEERVMLQMDVVDGATVATIARCLGIEQRPLYDRLKRLRIRLRVQLERAGVSREDVRAYIGEVE